MSHCPVTATRHRITNQKLTALALALAIFTVLTTFLPEAGVSSVSATDAAPTWQQERSFHPFAAPAVFSSGPQREHRS